MSVRAAKRIVIQAGSVRAYAELNDTRTAQKIYDALPIEAKANTWGDEIYFSILVRCDPENEHEVVQMGDLGYWGPGSAFCIFFGLTPASTDGKIRPASAVNVLGTVVGDPTVFKSVRGGTKVRIERD